MKAVIYEILLPIKYILVLTWQCIIYKAIKIQLLLRVEYIFFFIGFKMVYIIN